MFRKFARIALLLFRKKFARVVVVPQVRSRCSSLAFLFRKFARRVELLLFRSQVLSTTEIAHAIQCSQSSFQYDFSLYQYKSDAVRFRFNSLALFRKFARVVVPQVRSRCCCFASSLALLLFRKKFARDKFARVKFARVVVTPPQQVRSRCCSASSLDAHSGIS